MATKAVGAEMQAILPFSPAVMIFNFSVKWHENRLKMEKKICFVTNKLFWVSITINDTTMAVADTFNLDSSSRFALVTGLQTWIIGHKYRLRSNMNQRVSSRGWISYKNSRFEARFPVNKNFFSFVNWSDLRDRRISSLNFFVPNSLDYRVFTIIDIIRLLNSNLIL